MTTLPWCLSDRQTDSSLFFHINAWAYYLWPLPARRISRGAVTKIKPLDTVQSDRQTDRQRQTDKFARKGSTGTARFHPLITKFALPPGLFRLAAFVSFPYPGAYTGRFPACPGTTLKDRRVCLPEVRGRKSSLRSLDYTISYFRLSWICMIMKRCPRGQSKLDVFFGRKRIILAGSTVLDGRGQSVSCREPPKLESRVRHCIPFPLSTKTCECSKPLDVIGDHLVTCKTGGHVWAHNSVVSL